MLEILADPETWIAFSTLVVLELVLGIDNVVFISIMAGRLPEQQRRSAWRVGLMLALVTRLALLGSLAWIIGLTAPLVTVSGHEVSGRDIILLAGGLFLIVKATHEIHTKIDRAAEEADPTAGRAGTTFVGVIVQIAILDMVFSLDSVITAVGMVEEVAVMAAAIVVAIAITLAAAGPIGSFVEHNPSVKMLALSFLVLIGAALVADGLGQHIPKGYVYGPIAFSLGVEMLNIRASTRDRGTQVGPPRGQEGR